MSGLVHFAASLESKLPFTNTHEFPEGKACLFDLLVPSLLYAALFQEPSRMRDILYLFSTFPGDISSVYGRELLYPLSALWKG